jgi:hypothetical protein
VDGRVERPVVARRWCLVSSKPAPGVYPAPLGGAPPATSSHLRSRSAGSERATGAIAAVEQVRADAFRPPDMAPQPEEGRCSSFLISPALRYMTRASAALLHRPTWRAGSPPIKASARCWPTQPPHQTSLPITPRSVILNQNRVFFLPRPPWLTQL